MKLFKIKKNKGFTIIEALVAIFILSISVSAMLGVTASTISTARYTNNEITANYLLQEAIDSIRNSRDTIAFQMQDTGGGWSVFLDRYGSGSDKCFSTKGCYLKIENFDATGLLGNNDVVVCPSTGCPYLSYDTSGTSHYFYYYDTTTTKLSSFKRIVTMSVDDTYPDQVKVTVTVDWTNGSLSKSQSLETYLLNWKK